MKKVALFFCMPLLIMAAPIKYANLADAEDCIFVISEPRSGVNWLTACLQYLTKRALCTTDFRYKVGMNNRLRSEIDSSKSPFIRTHAKKRLENVDPYKNKLILIFRDYKENTIRRWYGESYKKVLTKGTLFDEQAARLAFFDRWPEENRHLVYYEDLLLNPKETLTKTLEFLGESDERMEEFLANFDSFKKLCLATYDQETKRLPLGPSISKGKDIHYHSKKVSKVLLFKADELFQKKYPDLWEKYLARYLFCPT